MSNSELRSSLRAGWRMALVLLGFSALLIAYYSIHKPITPSQIAVWGGLALDALTVGLLAGISGGIGRGVLGRLRAVAASGGLSRAERVALEGTLGLGAIGLGALLLGLLGLYRGLALWGALGAAGLLSIRHSIAWLRDLAAVIRHASPQTAWERFLAFVAGLSLVTGWLYAFAPPFAWDGLAYHLVGPQQYLANGRILADGDNFFMGFPQGAELVYGVGMSLFGRSTAAAPLHALYGLYGLLAVGGLIKRYTNASVGRGAAWLSVVLLLSAPSLWLQFGWPYVDLALFGYGACALAAITLWSSPPTQSAQGGGSGSGTALLLAGIYAGLALGAKYTGSALLFVLGVYITYECLIRRRDARAWLLAELTLVGAAALVFAPWLVKGLLLYQNPVYPFVFNGLNWDAERTRAFTTTESGLSLIESGQWWQIPFLPLTATLFGVEKGFVFEGANYYFATGPWLLTAPLVLFLGWRWLDERSRALGRVCVGLGLPLLFFWAVLSVLSPMGMQTRLLMVGLSVAAIGGGLAIQGLANWPRKPLDISFLTRAMLILTLLLGLFQTLGASARLAAFFLAADPEAYLNGALGAHIAAMRHLNELPEGSRVRLMWEPRSFYCPAHVVCLPDVLLDHWPNFLRKSGAPDEVFAQWRALGDDHLLLFHDGFQFYLNQDRRFIAQNTQFVPALEKHMTAIWSDEVGGYTLYAWKTEKTD